jgi:hypothetical protein
VCGQVFGPAQPLPSAGFLGIAQAANKDLSID